jgi:hypothetical protein
MISVINPSQYGAFSRSSGVVAYPEFYPYHMADTRQTPVLDPMARASSTSSACQFVSSSSSSRSYFPSATASPGTTTRLTSSQAPSSSSGCVQPTPRGLVNPNPGKDYSKPLFVDCSIEYELPNAPKIPKNSQPILMIPPTYQKKLIAQQQQQQQQQQQIQQRSSPCSGPQCRQCQEATLLRKKLKEAGDNQKRASKRSYSTAIEVTENGYKQSLQGNSNLFS